MVLGSSDTASSVLFPRSSRLQSSRRPGTRTWQACRRRSSSRTTVSSDVLPRRCILAIEAATPTQVPGLVPLCAHRSTARVGPASSGWDDSATGCSPTDAYVGPCSTFAISAATARSWSRSPRGVTTEPPPRDRLQSQLRQNPGHRLDSASTQAVQRGPVSQLASNMQRSRHLRTPLRDRPSEWPSERLHP